MTRILVVDDSLSVRKALEKILTLHAEVVIAINAEDALAKLQSGEIAPDLVITDVLMPGMSGFELTDELRRLPVTAETPVMLMSGIIDDEVHAHAGAVGARAVVRKPFTAEELLPVIQQILAGSVLLPEAAPALAEAGTDSGEPELITGSTFPEAAPEAPVAVAAGPVGAQPNADAVSSSNPFNLSDPPAPMPAAIQPGAADPALQALVGVLTEKPGVLGALVTDSDGVPLEVAGELGVSASDLGMYARFLAGTASALGVRLTAGTSTGLQLEFSGRTLLIVPLGAGQRLVCVLSDANSVSMVRFALRRHLAPQPA